MQSNRFSTSTTASEDHTRGLPSSRTSYDPKQNSSLTPKLTKNGIQVLIELEDKEKYKDRDLFFQIVSIQEFPENIKSTPNKPLDANKIANAVIVKYNISDGELQTRALMQNQIHERMTPETIEIDEVQFQKPESVNLLSQDVQEQFSFGPHQSSKQDSNHFQQSKTRDQYVNQSDTSKQLINLNQARVPSSLISSKQEQQINQDDNQKSNKGFDCIKTHQKNELLQKNINSNYNTNQIQQQQKQQSQGLSDYMPIKALNTFSRDWKIQARIVQKSEKRQTRNGGSLLKMELLDTYGTIIEATFFNVAADFFEDKLLLGRVYDFYDGNIKLANKKFSTVNNDFTITFEKSSQIKEAVDNGSIKKNNVEYSYIKAIENLKQGSNVDLIGVIIDISMADQIKLKNSKSRTRQYITIMDDSMCSISLTLWGDICSKNDRLQKGDILSFTGGRVSDYGGKSVNLSDDHTTIQLNPEDCPKTRQLKNWYQGLIQYGDESQHNIKQLSTSLIKPDNSLNSAENLHIIEANSSKPNKNQLNFICEIQANLNDENDVDQHHFFYLNGYVSYIKNDDKIFYNACPKDTCKRKVVQESNGTFRCEACNKSYDSCIPTYMIQAKITDFTDSIYINFAREHGASLMGMTALEFREFRNRATEEEISNYFDKLLFKQFNIMVKGKFEYYSGENRIRFFAIKVYPIHVQTENKALLKRLKMYSHVQPKEDADESL
ncbi:replication protein a 70 kda dna-binding [Stylonychia lemnae]|uniref:Replication protein a 70 kDa dna-binding n=1 Tax=Stylonychia lemnae TaxID=5949 RepID=A0A078AFL2_STYLE|nr:replication protein a 70 kda dna-binding [Stylonychia lemnae]|eukprot:CDW80297.1 replication protein a 70 kda dna-binding [Stylonychia lemnae]